MCKLINTIIILIFCLIVFIGCKTFSTIDNTIPKTELASPSSIPAPNWEDLPSIYNTTYKFIIKTPSDKWSFIKTEQKLILMGDRENLTRNAQLDIEEVKEPMTSSDYLKKVEIPEASINFSDFEIISEENIIVSGKEAVKVVLTFTPKNKTIKLKQWHIVIVVRNIAFILTIQDNIDNFDKQRDDFNKIIDNFTILH